jgi:hypothetical protein
MKNISILLISVLFFLSSCQTTRLDLPEDKSIEPIPLPFRIKEIKFSDDRNGLPPMNWDLAIKIAKTKDVTGNPELSQLSKMEMEKIIRKAESKTNSDSAIFEIKITRGECQLKPHRGSIREYVKITAELKITFSNKSDKYESVAEGNYEYQIFDNSKEHAIQIYNLVMRNVTAELLKVVRDEIDK